MKLLRQTSKENPLALFGLELPSEEGSQIAANLLQESTPLQILSNLTQPSHAFISTTKITNTVICHRQHRNIHGRIFGGFLMRQAFELAFITAYQFLGSQPVFREIDRIVFRRPVEISDILRFESCVIWTSPKSVEQQILHPLVHVEVIATIIRPEKQLTMNSNVFHFTFESRDGRDVKRVLPLTIEEALRVAHVIELNKLQNTPM